MSNSEFDLGHWHSQERSGLSLLAVLKYSPGGIKILQMDEFLKDGITKDKNKDKDRDLNYTHC